MRKQKHVIKSHEFRVTMKITIALDGAWPDKLKSTVYAKTESGARALQEAMLAKLREITANRNLGSDSLTTISTLRVGEAEISLGKTLVFRPKDVRTFSAKMEKWLPNPDSYRGGKWFRIPQESGEFSTVVATKKYVPESYEDEDD